jgi:uncharacterized coiled-coil protein SlyX
MKLHNHTEDTRIALLEQSINNINDTMLRMEKRFDRLESKVDNISKEMKEGFKDCNNRIWNNFYWNLAALTGLGALMAHGFKWF